MPQFRRAQHLLKPIPSAVPHHSWGSADPGVWRANDSMGREAALCSGTVTWKTRISTMSFSGAQESPCSLKHSKKPEGQRIDYNFTHMTNTSTTGFLTPNPTENSELITTSATQPAQSAVDPLPSRHLILTVISALNNRHECTAVWDVPLWGQ